MKYSCNATYPDTRIDVEPGQTLSADGSMQIVIPSTITKDATAPWAAGSGNGSLDNGVMSPGFYHIHAIANPTSGATDILTSGSFFNPKMPTGFTARRWVGGFAYNPGDTSENGIFKFENIGDWHFYKRAKGSALNLAIGPTMQLVQLAIPFGVPAEAEITLIAANTSGAGTYLTAGSPDVMPVTASPGTAQWFANAGNYVYTKARVMTNNISQISVGADTSTNMLSVYNLGWRIDRSIYR